MAAMAHPNITDFYSSLAKAKDQEETARIVSKAVEELSNQQEARFVHYKQEVVAEVNVKDQSMKEYLQQFATKEDLKQCATKEDLKTLKLEMRLETHQIVSTAKWQVLGGTSALFFVQVILKHFGIW
jgi:hypothetical protein